MGPKSRGTVCDTSGKSKVLSYCPYYYLFFDMPAFHVIDHADGITENNIY